MSSAPEKLGERTLERQCSLGNKRLRRLLVRVRTVSECHPLHRPRQFLSRQLCGRVLFPKVTTDGLVVRRRHLEGLERKHTPHTLPHIPVPLLPGFQERRVVPGIGEDGDAVVVLGGGAQERDAADVDLFDCVCEGAGGFGDGFCERVEVADDDGDGRDALCLEVFFVRWDRAGKDAWWWWWGVLAVIFLEVNARQTSVYGRMESLHSSAQHFRRFRYVRNISSEQIRLYQPAQKYCTHSIGMPASLIFLAVPPDPSNLTPAWCSPVARSIK
jgi:hypothetical protein